MIFTKRWARMLPVVFFFVVFGAGIGFAAAEEKTLWKQGENSILSSLPDGWHAMVEAELAAFAVKNENSLHNSGTLVSGFHEQKEGNEAGVPYIVVFKSEGTRITRAEMQKTFSWFQKNSELAQGVLPTNVRRVTVENIEYLQDRFAILFQTRIEMEDRVFLSASSVFFLQNGYLSVSCYAPENQFPNYVQMFYDFIDDISIAPGLRYPQNGDSSSRDLWSLAVEWLIRYWQQMLGIILLCGIYSLVFLRGKKKYGRRENDKILPPNAST